MSYIKKILAKNDWLYKKIVEIKYFYDYISNKRLVLIKSPEALVNKLYKKYLHKTLNLDNPQTFNEKLQWLKLYWYDETAIICSNKYLVREYVRQKGLGYLLNNLIGVYKSASDIKIESLPDRFVLKPTHDSGHTIICEDKNKFNFKKTKKILNKWLKVDYEFKSGEWPYRSDEKAIICEEYIEDKKAGELLDYKFFCFNGNPELIFFVSDRAHHARSDFYDLEWNPLPFRWYYEPSWRIFPKPSKLNDMIEYAKKLSEGFPFVRVDFYQIGEKVYFGELTFFHGGGLGYFEPESIDYDLGNKIVLPPKADAWKNVRRR